MTLPEGGAPPRSLPRGLASIVEALELRQARLVDIADLEAIRVAAGLRTPANVLAARVRGHGWLLPTARRGVYEFAPGAHARAFSRGDLTLPLQAALHDRPELVAGLTLQSAAWALGAADRSPARLEVAAGDAKTRAVLVRALGEQARVTVFAPRLRWLHRRGAPVLAPASLLVHLAARPRDVRSWSSVTEWLPDVAAEVVLGDLRQELSGRPASVAVRAGYLLSGLRPDLVEQLPPVSPGKVWFGPRGPLLRHDYRWQVADTLLPFDPRALPSVAPEPSGPSAQSGPSPSEP